MGILQPNVFLSTNAKNNTLFVCTKAAERYRSVGQVVSGHDACWGAHVDHLIRYQPASQQASEQHEWKTNVFG